MTDTNKTDKKQLNDHDIFVRGILGVTELALTLLRYYIPKGLQKYIDFSTLKLLSDTHIDKVLSPTYSDTIHECMLKKEALPLHKQLMKDLPSFRFCILWEHKSSKPSEPIEFQVEDYRKSIIRADLKNKRPPSIVLPILIYHGQTKWHKKLLHEQMSDFLPDAIMEYVPFPKYIIIDLQALTDNEIEKITDLGMLRGVFIALKHAQQEEFFRQNPEKILNFVEGLSSRYLFDEILRMVLEYMQRRSKLGNDAFEEILNKTNPDMATNFKTFIEVAEEKGLEKGIEKGVIAFIRSTNLTDAQIAKELDVEIDYVQDIRQRMKSVTKKFKNEDI